MLVDPIAPHLVISLATQAAGTFSARAGSLWRAFGNVVALPGREPVLAVKLLVAEPDLDYALYSSTVLLRRTLLRKQGFS